MLTFKDFITEQVIDWDYVFDFITEESETPQWEVSDNKRARIHKHIFNVPDNSGADTPVVVKVVHNKQTGEHDVSYNVGGAFFAGTVSKDLPPKSRQAAMSGIARAMNHYAENHVAPGESITAETSDKEYAEKGKRSPIERKADAHTILFQRFARKKGWSYKRPDIEDLDYGHILTKPKTG